MQPIDHTSIAVLYDYDPNKISGALYRKVATSCVYDLSGSPKVRANPKSANLTVLLSSPIKILLGFRSLCMIRF